MTGPPPDPDLPERRGDDAGTPRWVKVSWIIGIILVLLFLVVLLSGRGHGPGMHGGPGTPTQTSSEMEPGSNAPPEGRR